MRLLIFFVWVCCSTAFAVVPSIALTRTANCVLADDDHGEARVKCWSTYAGALEIPELSHPRALAAGEDSICAIDDRGVQCWIDQNDFHHHWYQVDRKLQQMFADLREPQAIVGGAMDNYCVWDKAQGMRCADGYVLRDTPPQIPNLGEPVEMAVGSGVACAILADKTLHCFGPFDQIETSQDPKTPELLAVPTDLKDPQGLAISYGKACVIDQGALRCWGKWQGEKPRLAAEERYAHQLTSTWAWIDAGHPNTGLGKWPATETALLAAARGDRTCFLAEQAYYCAKDGYFSRSAHGLHARYAEKRELPAILKLAGAATYATRRKPYDEAGRLLASGTFEENYFVYRALTPLIEGTDSAAFKERILPAYQNARAYWDAQLHVQKLNDFAASEANLRNALELMVTLVPDTDWDEFKAALGAALASNGDGAALRTLREAGARAPFPTLLGGRDAAAGQTLQALLAFVTH